MFAAVLAHASRIRNPTNRAKGYELAGISLCFFLRTHTPCVKRNTSKVLITVVGRITSSVKHRLKVPRCTWYGNRSGCCSSSSHLLLAPALFVPNKQTTTKSKITRAKVYKRLHVVFGLPFSYYRATLTLFFIEKKIIKQSILDIVNKSIATKWEIV